MSKPFEFSSSENLWRNYMKVGAINIYGKDLKLSENVLETLESKISKIDIIKHEEKFMDPMFFCFGESAVEGGKSYLIDPKYREIGLSFWLYRWPFWDPHHQKEISLAAGGNDFEESRGYEYLSKINNFPKSRIQAIRNKINNLRKSEGEYLNPDNHMSAISSIVSNSKDTLIKYADSAAEGYKKAKRASKEIQDFIDKNKTDFQGISSLDWKSNFTDDAKATYQVSLNSIKDNFNFKDIVKESSLFADLSKESSTSDLLKKSVKEYGPYASQLSKAVKLAISNGISDSSKSGDERVAAGLEAIGTLAAAIPVYGPFISLACNGIAGFLNDQSDKNNAACKKDQDIIKDLIVDTLQKHKLPIPFHIREAFNQDCKSTKRLFSKYATTDDLASTMRILRQNLFFFRELPSGLRESIKQWWALSLLYMGDPAVTEVFAALCNDCLGGCIASDEQVMLVAAPIAVANGLDIDDFARKLFYKSKGWKSAIDSARYYVPFSWEKSRIFEKGPIVVGGVGSFQLVGDPSTELALAFVYDRSPRGIEFHNVINVDSNEIWKVSSQPGSESDPCWTRVPCNAWWLQLGVLTSDAFDLLNEIQRKKIEERRLKDKEEINKEDNNKQYQKDIYFKNKYLNSLSLMIQENSLASFLSPVFFKLYLNEKEKK